MRRAYPRRTETRAPTAPVALAVRDLVARYSAQPVVKGVSFDVGASEFVTLLGPSGCGKSTTLRCVAGLHPVLGGTISLGDELLSSADVHLRPEQRRINMVFQSYAIWPHMTVAQNVAYGLRRREADRAQRSARVRDLLELVGLEDFADRGASGLSGGQQQRVALARALATRPRVLLLDEPLSNLDAVLRARMRLEIMRIHRETATTTLYVTHDRREALSMSDRIIVLRDGLIEQSGTPEELYDRPISRFVAEFLGIANLVRGRVTHVEERCVRVLARGLGDERELVLAPRRSDRHPQVGDEVDVVIRPEMARPASGDAANPLRGELIAREFFGNRAEMTIRCGPSELKLEADRSMEPGADGAFAFELPPESLTWVPVLPAPPADPVTPIPSPQEATA